MTKPYRLHGICQSGNCYKIALYLNCAGLDWEPIYVDLFGGETRTPEWRARVNPMGEVPVLEIGNESLTQSAVILRHLAETTGKFQPPTAALKEEALRWMFYDNYRFTNYYATRRFLKCFQKESPDPAVLAFFKMRADGALAVVEKHLETHAFMVGSEPTVADFSLVGYMYFPEDETGYNLASSHPAIFAWTERIRALPGWKQPYDLMPGPYIKPLR